MKRSNISRACESCRKHKKRCDGAIPVCSHCARYGYRCVVASNRDKRKPVTKSHHEALQTRIEMLERELEAVGHRRRERSEKRSIQGSGTPSVVDEMAQNLCAQTIQRRGYHARNSSNPDLSEDVYARILALPRPLFEHLLGLSFDYGCSYGRIVPRKHFFESLVSNPGMVRNDRSSVFSLSAVLAMGCCYLDEATLLSFNFHIDGLEESLTRNPKAMSRFFADLAKSLLAYEVSHPLYSTLSGLNCLAIREIGMGDEATGLALFAVARQLADDLALISLVRKRDRDDEESFENVHSSLTRIPRPEQPGFLCYWSLTTIDIAFAIARGTQPLGAANYARDLSEGMDVPITVPSIDLSFPRNATLAFRELSKLTMVAIPALADLCNEQISDEEKSVQITASILRLEEWHNQLESPLRTFSHSPSQAKDPHILTLSATYWALVILLHQKQPSSLRRRSEACIAMANLVAMLRTTLGLEKAPSLLAPLLAVACLDAIQLLTITTAFASPTPGTSKAQANRPHSDLMDEVSSALVSLIAALQGISRTWLLAADLKSRIDVYIKCLDLDRSIAFKPKRQSHQSHLYSRDPSQRDE
ncbi:hypothetical protein FA10DRAFT_118166 [Acaromyces ingoldii]|uniref:Zn(2)-C6 fungal-type domain-containing protein n=1 Tax=Acaromyces ingoldii TaxID=215250 RepID=A0A316YP75_9BASI|nr:hypothetical protein FA10DRAFT_118166 [Acaromyces ingoldii]PWN90604.1 hypothetical protein FA10DRAFT_118166 [Acaromyces ingoldii]